MDVRLITRPLRIFLLGLLALWVLGGSITHLTHDGAGWAENSSGIYLLVDGSQGEDPHVNG